MEFTEYDSRVSAYAVVIEDGRMLMSWYVGQAPKGEKPGWTLPGGGVEFHESLEEAVVREVKEETGYDVELDGLLATHSFTQADHPRGRPFKAVRVVYEAHVVGGALGTIEVDGTTERAGWIPIADAVDPDDSRSALADVALRAWERRRSSAV